MQVNAKLMEVMAGRSMLTAEISKLQHALQREVGDHVPISKVDSSAKNLFGYVCENGCNEQNLYNQSLLILEVQHYFQPYSFSSTLVY